MAEHRYTRNLLFFSYILKILTNIIHAHVLKMKNRGGDAVQ
jgi:hypothetical protein